MWDHLTLHPTAIKTAFAIRSDDRQNVQKLPPFVFRKSQNRSKLSSAAEDQRDLGRRVIGKFHAQRPQQDRFAGRFVSRQVNKVGRVPDWFGHELKRISDLRNGVFRQLQDLSVDRFVLAVDDKDHTVDVQYFAEDFATPWRLDKIGQQWSQLLSSRLGGDIPRQQQSAVVGADKDCRRILRGAGGNRKRSGRMVGRLVEIDHLSFDVGVGQHRGGRLIR